MSDPESNSMQPEMSGEDFEAMLAEGAGACPPLELLYAAHEDVLPPEVADPILRHAARCSLCQALLSDREDSVALFTPERSARVLAAITAKSDGEDASKRKAASNVVSMDAARMKRRRMVFAAIAAGLVVAALVTGARVYLRGTQEMASVPESKAPEAPVIANAAHREQVLAEVATVEPLAPPSSRGSDLLTRGQQRGAVGEPSSAELLPAFHSYNHGDYAGAEKAFADVEAQYPKSKLPVLYRGVTQLELHEDASALATLKPLTGDGAGGDEVWYAGVAAARVGDPTAAGLFARACQLIGTHQHKACQLAALY